MSKAPYARAAFINAIAEEGTKEDAVKFLQETWNELCEARARLAEVEAALATARRDALEEAAKVAEDHFPATQDMESTMICGALEEVAAAIRALANEAEP